MSHVSRDARFQAALLAKGRFVGRKALESAATHDDLALADLRARLGFPSAATELREARIARIAYLAETPALPVWRISHLGCVAALTESIDRVTAFAVAERIVDASASDLDKLAFASLVSLSEEDSALAKVVRATEARWDSACRVSPTDVRKAKAESRKAARAGDKIGTRTEGHMVRRFAKIIAKRLYDDAGFRGATHRHSVSVKFGEPSATSSTDQVRPSAVGLPNAYSQKGYWVATSEHSIVVDEQILSSEVRALNKAAPVLVLYLTPTMRVVQSRGTSLRVEHKRERGGWS